MEHRALVPLALCFAVACAEFDESIETPQLAVVSIAVDPAGTLTADGFPARLGDGRVVVFDADGGDPPGPMVWFIDCERRQAQGFDPLTAVDRQAIRDELGGAPIHLPSDVTTVTGALRSLCPVGRTQVSVAAAAAEASGTQALGSTAVAVAERAYGSLRATAAGLGTLRLAASPRHGDSGPARDEVINSTSCGYPAECGPPSRRPNGECLCDEEGRAHLVERYDVAKSGEADLAVVWHEPHDLIWVDGSEGPTLGDVAFRDVAFLEVGGIRARGASCFGTYDEGSDDCLGAYVRVMRDGEERAYPAHRSIGEFVEAAWVSDMAFSPDRRWLFVTSVKLEADCSYDARGTVLTRIDLTSGEQVHLGTEVDIWNHDDYAWDHGRWGAGEWRPEFVWRRGADDRAP